jgi:flagellar hook protein FlgE
LRLARFPNPHGLAQQAGTKFRATPASGLAIEVEPGTSGAAEIIGGATELSNVDIGSELIDMTMAGNQFRVNLEVFQTADTLLDELLFTYRQW